MEIEAYNLNMRKDRFEKIIRKINEEMPFLNFRKKTLKRRPNFKYEKNEGYLDIVRSMDWVRYIDGLGGREVPYYLVLTDMPLYVEVMDFSDGQEKIVYPIGYRSEDVAAVSSFRLGRKKGERTAKVALYELFKILTRFEGVCKTNGCYVRSDVGEMATSAKEVKKVISRIDRSHRFCRRCKKLLSSLQTNLNNKD